MSVDSNTKTSIKACAICHDCENCRHQLDARRADFQAYIGYQAWFRLLLPYRLTGIFFRQRPPIANQVDDPSKQQRDHAVYWHRGGRQIQCQSDYQDAHNCSIAQFLCTNLKYTLVSAATTDMHHHAAEGAGDATGWF